VIPFGQCYCNLLTDAIQPAPQFSVIHTHTHGHREGTQSEDLSTQIAWRSHNLVYKSFRFVLPGMGRLFKRRNKRALREHARVPTSHFNANIYDDAFTKIPDKLRCSVVLSCRSLATFRRNVLTVFMLTAVRTSNPRKNVHGFKRPQKNAKRLMPGCGTQPDTNSPVKTYHSCSNKPHHVTASLHLKEAHVPASG
jgi:hypothetical protein